MILKNFNTANFVSQEEGAFNQTISVGITNNYENYNFDILIFEVDDDGKSEDLECYKTAVFNKEYTKDCNFGQTLKFTEFNNVQSQTYEIKNGLETNDKDRIVVIDNSPFPKDGANAGAGIVLEYASSSSYMMSYNLRATSIYMGIVSLIVSFGIGMLVYLSIKIRRDIKNKFEHEDPDE